MKPASRSLHDYGQLQRAIMLMIMLGGTYYWSLARYHTGPILSETEYGPFILSFSAEFWSIPLALGGAVHLLAQVVNGDPRLKPWITPAVRLLASIVVAGNMIMFSYGGLLAPVWGPFFAYTFMGAVLVLWFAFLAAGDFVRGLGSASMG